MGRPGFFLVDDPTVTEFPRADRAGSNPIIYDHTDLIHETEEGVIWPYPQARRRRFELNFRVNREQLSVFEDLHLSVNGQILPFYFVLDVDDPDVNFLVRKEQGFYPKELGESSGVMYYDYTLIMRTEVSSSVGIQS